MIGKYKRKSKRCLEDEPLLGYLDGTLSRRQRKKVESHLLSCSVCRESLALCMRILQPDISAEEQAQLEQVGLDRLAAQAKALHREEWGRPQAMLTPMRPGVFVPWRLAASVAALMSVAAVVWFLFIHQSEVEQGMLALKRAYAQERPLEARLTGGFPYAPYETKRGEKKDSTNQTLLTFAHETLTRAVLREGTPEAHHALGLSYLAEHQYDEALEQLESALVEDPDDPRLHSDIGVAYWQKAERDRSGADFAQAIEHFTKALDQEPTLLEAIFNRALCYQKMFLFSQAEADWQRYLQLDPTSPWADEAKRHLKLIAEQRKTVSQKQEEVQQNFLNVYRAHDDAAARALIDPYPAQIEPLIEQTLDDYLAFSTAGDLPRATEKLLMARYIGQLFSELKQDQYCRDVVDELTATTPQQKKTLFQARQLVQQASAKYQKAEYQNALALYRQARATFAATGQTSSVELTDYWIGDILFQLLQFKPSASSLMQVAATCQVHEHRKLRAMALLRAGMAYFQLDQRSISNQLDRQALELFQALKDSSGILQSLLSSAWNALQYGKYEQSLNLYLQACRVLYQHSWKPSKICQLYWLAALTLNQMERHRAAAACQEEAVQFALQSKNEQFIAGTQEDLGLLYGRLGRPAAGMSKVEAALTHTERIQDEVTRDGRKAYTLLIRGQLLEQQGQPAEAISAFNQALRIFEAQGNHYYAAQVRRAKVKPLLEVSEFDDAEAELKASLDYIERNRRSIASQEQRIGFYAQGRDVYDTNTWFQFAVKGDPAAAFDAAETSRARSLLDLLQVTEKLQLKLDRGELVISGSSEPLRLAQIQSALPAQTQLVEYAVTQDRVIIWAISPEGFHVGESRVSEVELARLVEELRRAIEQKSKREIVNRLAGRLYDLLMRPVKRHLVPGQQLCLIPDKSLYYVPFAALWDSDSRTHLIEHYALLSSPSASVFVQCLHKARAKGSGWPAMLSVGNPRFNREIFPRLADLPTAELEAERCAAYYQRPQVLTREQATEPAVVNAMESAETVNLAVHCVVNEYAPMLSKLILAPSDRVQRPQFASWIAPVDREDGMLHAYEIYQLSFPRTRLVVLSACQSGLGRYYLGEGVVGIARPFIARGVPAVVASLWAVESSATAQLIERFHQQRQESGLSVSRALRAAQLGFLKDSAAVYSHPYFWSSFILMGADVEVRN